MIDSVGGMYVPRRSSKMLFCACLIPVPAPAPLVRFHWTIFCEHAIPLLWSSLVQTLCYGMTVFPVTPLRAINHTDKQHQRPDHNFEENEYWRANEKSNAPRWNIIIQSFWKKFIQSRGKRYQEVMHSKTIFTKY